MESSTPTFTYLRSKLEEWKDNDLLLPPAELSWGRFQEVATDEILPVLCEAKAALEAIGLEVQITDLDENTRCLGFYVNDVGLFFPPNEDAMTVHFMARRFTAKEQGYESRFLYKRAEPLSRLVERPYFVSSAHGGTRQLKRHIFNYLRNFALASTSRFFNHSANRPSI